MPLAKNNIVLLSLFQFVLLSLFLSFTFLFILFCFSKKYIKRSFTESPGHLRESKLLDIFAEREKERERESPKSSYEGGGRVVRWLRVNFQCRGVVLIWIIVGQGPIALAVGAGRGCLDIFLSSVCLSFLYFSLFG